MAEELAGRLFIELLPDVDRKKFQAAVDASTKGVEADVPVGLKLKPGAVKAVEAQAKAQANALKVPPAIPVNLKIARGAAANAIREANRQFKDLKRPPQLNVGLNVTATAAKSAIRDANKKLKAAKVAPPKLDVQLNLDVNELEAIKEVRVLSKEVEAAIRADPIELNVDLDDAAQARLLEKVRLLKAKADAAGIAAFERTQGRLRALEERGLDQRSLINQRFENQRALIHERANARIQRSSGLTLRVLRNDFSQFDASTTRILRRLGLVFAGFTAGIAASFAAIGVAALRSFAQTETQIRRTAAVLGTDAFSETIASTNSQTEAFAAFRREVERTDAALRSTVELTALKTVFDPTEIAAGTRALAQAGLKTEEIKASLLGVAQFAQNEELLPEEAVANLVQGATAAGQSLKELTLLSDQFTFVANDTTASAKEVAEAFANRAAPAFRAYGESVSSTLTVLDLFARAGIRGKTAGEQTGILIREINKASTKTKDSAAAWERYGIAIGKVNGRQVPFLETLAELGTLLETVRKEQGSQGLARIRKELGLTEKSGAGLLQILPQITRDTAGSAEAAVRGLQNVQAQIERSGGATARQAEIITNTLGFQFEQFTNQIGTLFRIAAGPTGTALTETFRRFNDQLETGSENGSALRDRFLEIGRAISERVVPALERFFFGGEGADFIGGVVEMYRGFLVGLQDAFVEFRRAAFGEGSNAGFFTVLGNAFAAIGRFAENTLPRIGRAFGTITKLIRDNEGAVRSFLKAWLLLFVFSKSLRLVIVPLGSLNTLVATLTGFNLAERLVSFTKAMWGYNAATKAAAASTSALTIAQAGAAAGTATGPARPGNAKAGTGLAIGATAAQAASVGKLRAALAGLRSVIGRLGLIGAAVAAAIEVAIGAVRGFREEWARLTEGDGGPSFRAGLDAIRAALGLLVDALRFVGNVIQQEGEKWGRALAQSVYAITVSIGAVINFVKGAAAAIRDAFWAVIRAIGDSVSSVARMMADISGRIGALPGGGKFREWSQELHGAANAADMWGQKVKDASDKTIASIAPVPKYLRDARQSVWVLNEEWVRQKGIIDVAATQVRNGARNMAKGILDYIPGASDALSRFNETIRQTAANNAALAAEANTINRFLIDQGVNSVTQLTPQSQMDVFNASQQAAAVARLRALKLYPPAMKAAGDAAKKAAKDIGGGGGGGGSSFTSAVEDASEATKEVKTAADIAAEAVNRLTQTQLNAKSAQLVARVQKATASGYKATAVEAEILRRTLPAVEAQLQSQTEAVSQLDAALQALQSTQLLGTKAFNDQAFQFDQQVKQLQLQRLDLIIGGTPEQDASIAAIDEQIAALQQQAQRAQLAFDIDTAPLQKKLEELFSPVKELSFDQITAEFKKLGGQKAPLIEAIAGGENLKAALEATIKDADARFGDAGRQVTAGFVGGMKTALPTVVVAGKATGDAALTGVNNVMQFGSPSRTMIQRGVWVNEGFIQGINSTLGQVQRAGVDTMWGFLEGMRNVYTNRVQPFVIQIAEWIRDNKGPIEYDRTLLRPAGQAMMDGFHGGLRDGFGEIQSWVRQVGPSLANDSFPKDILIKRSAHFLLNNARMDAAFDPQDAFGDLLFDAGLLGSADGVPSNLSFLHRTLSSADTLDMAQKLAAMFSVPISDFIRPPGTRTTSGNVSDHTFGTAVDFSNGSSPTPQMDALYAAIDPLLGTIFKQILYRTFVGGNHFNHVHAAWLKGDGFSMDSGKKGGLNIPGVPSDVLDAIAYASEQTRLDPLLIAAVMKQESGFRKSVVSPDGGYGLMQLTSSGLVSRADQLGGRFNPRINALVGSEYLRDLINQLGSIKLGLSAYNSGPGGGERFGQVDVPSYVASVLRFFEDFKRRFSGSGNFRAQGGNMNAGDVYHVNERGEELFIPGRGGTMISAKDFRAMVEAIQQGGRGEIGTTVYDQRQINVSSNSDNSAVVRQLVDSRMRSQIVGVRR